MTKITDRHKNWIKKTINESLSCFGRQDLKELVYFDFNNTNEEHIACARTVNPLGATISINEETWLKLSYYQRIEILVHELCHVLCDWDNEDDGENHHGGHWAKLMESTGYRARERYRWKVFKKQ